MSVLRSPLVLAVLLALIGFAQSSRAAMVFSTSDPALAVATGEAESNEFAAVADENLGNEGVPTISDNSGGLSAAPVFADNHAGSDLADNVDTYVDTHVGTFISIGETAAEPVEPQPDRTGLSVMLASIFSISGAIFAAVLMIWNRFRVS